MWTGAGGQTCTGSGFLTGFGGAKQFAQMLPVLICMLQLQHLGQGV